MTEITKSSRRFGDLSTGDQTPISPCKSILLVASTQETNQSTHLIISHSHKFVFVKTNKTAGSSFEGLLSHYLNAGDWATRAQRAEEEYRAEAFNINSINYLNGNDDDPEVEVKQHANLIAAHSKFPESERYLTFGILRNPFSRLMSSFRWRKNGQIQKILKKKINPLRQQDLLKEKFLAHIVNDQGALNARGVNLLFGADSQRKAWGVDYIFKLEDLQKPKSVLHQQLGLDIDLDKMPRFKGNTIKIPSDIILWDKETIKAATKMFSWEFANLDYPPTPFEMNN